MTAEPRDVEDWCGSPIAHEPHPGCSGWPSVEAREFIESAAVLAEPYNETIAALGSRLAAADRENAELRGEVERLRALPVWTGQWVQESIADRWKSERDEARALIARQLGDCIGCSPQTGPEETCPRDGRTYTEWVEIASMVIGRQHANEAERDDLRAQLTAAQAQLAEAREVGDLNGQEADNLLARAEAAEARLEAVRDYVTSARATESTDHAAGWNLALTAVGKTLAALAAAPQPEPDLVTAAGGFCVPLFPQSDGSVKVGRATTPEPDDGCAECTESGARNCVAGCNPEPSAGDEPARCWAKFCALPLDHAGTHQRPDATLDQLRTLIDLANERHLHDAEQWLRERVEAAEERMAALPVDCWPGFDR